MSRLARLVVLASGGGSNLQALIDACARGEVPACIVGVGCDRPQAFALDRARRHGIEAACLTLAQVRSEGQTRDDYDARLADWVADRSPDLVVLAGFMHILSPRFLARFAPDAVVNVHPSLLPDDPRADEVALAGRVHRVFRGPDALAQALAAGVDTTGTTVHFVTAEVDRGPVLGRASVAVLAGDTLEALRTRVQAAEHGLLARVVGDLLRSRGFQSVPDR